MAGNIAFVLFFTLFLGLVFTFEIYPWVPSYGNSSDLSMERKGELCSERPTKARTPHDGQNVRRVEYDRSATVQWKLDENRNISWGYSLLNDQRSRDSVCFHKQKKMCKFALKMNFVDFDLLTHPSSLTSTFGSHAKFLHISCSSIRPRKIEIFWTHPNLISSSHIKINIIKYSNCYNYFIF